jgi:uncharacterized protein (DUF427 family)
MTMQVDEFAVAAQMGRALGITPDFPAVEPTPRWVRVKVGDQVVADSRRALLYRQYGPKPMLPTYYVPVSDVAEGVLTDPRRRDDGSVLYAVEAGGRRVEGAAWTYHSPTGDFAALDDMVTFTWWDDHITWLEEDEEVFAHARDPHKRVDVVASTRHVQVRVDGGLLADSRRPLVLFETHLPTRYYLPADDVRMDRLEESETRTPCPYKGWARYWSVRNSKAHRDIAWSYTDPVPENPRIAGLVCFYNERVEVVVDGQPEERASSPFG